MSRIFFALFVFTFFAQVALAKDIREQRVEGATKAAIKIIDKALTRNSPMQEVLLEMRQSFGDIQWLPHGQNFPHCLKKPGIRAFVTHGVRTIHLCANLFEEEWDQNSMAQILLHESAHVAGIHDECQTTKYEIGALKLAKKRISFQSDYWKSCHITSKFDPFEIVVTPQP